MSLRLSGRNPLSYSGVEPLQPPDLVYVHRDPISGPVANADFRNFNVGTFWLNPVNQTLWILVRKPDSNPLWIQLGITAAGFLQTLTADNAVAVVPFGLNINVIGDTNITTVGNNLTHSVQITLNPSITVVNLTATGLATINNLTVTGNIKTNLSQGVVQSPGAGGNLFASEGANGQVLISGGVGFQPVWANITSGDGSITITNGAGTIDLSTAGGSGTVSSLTGNDNIAVLPNGGGTIFVKTANSTPTFLSGIANQETLDFGLDNLVLGTSLPNVTVGDFNVGLGNHVFEQLTSGDFNTAIGDQVLRNLTSGSDNTALGSDALINLVTGSSNVAIGDGAGNVYTTESNNILIDNIGVIGDQKIIRIGDQGFHLEAFMAGITGVTVANENLVAIDSVTGQLGVSSVSGPLNTLTGNTGPAATPLGANINIKTANTNVVFDGAAVLHQLTQDFALTSNLLLGSSGSLIGTASNNVGVGQNSLNLLTNGTDNTAVGVLSLTGLTNGSRNTAVGWDALTLIATQNDNTAVGWGALSNSIGTANTAVGSAALVNVTSGTDNIALGQGSGVNLTGAESANIYIGNAGVKLESVTTRIGTNGIQTRAFMAGIRGVIPASGPLNMVTIGTDGQLGSQAIPSGGGGIMIVTQFDFTGGPQTWTKDPATRQVLLLIWNGGNGGGSGRQGTDGGPVGGGGGGSGGGALYWYGPAAGWAASETVTVGAGGPGGIGQVTPNTDGNDGGAGSVSSVGSMAALPSLVSFGGKGIAGSSTTVNSVSATITSFGISAGTSASVSGIGKISSGTAGQNRTEISSDAFFPSPGGGGGGARSAATATFGGAGGNQEAADATIIYAGGAGGVEGVIIDGSVGASAVFTNGGFYFGGAGGGGGGGQHLGPVAGNGGDGGVPGGGGGGGGGSLNGTTSGAGGNGGNGRVIIIEFT